MNANVVTDEAKSRRAAEEHEGRIRRAAKRLESLVVGWIELKGFPDNPDREEVLAALTPSDRAAVLEVERLAYEAIASPEVGEVLDYLRRNRFEFNALLTLARTEATLPIRYEVRDSASQHFETVRNYVREWMRTGDFLPCATCFYPVVYFINGDKLDWPDLDRHECQIAAIPSRAPITQRPAFQRAQTAEGSRGRPRNVGRA